MSETIDQPGTTDGREMRSLVQTFDWSRTALGPRHTWPQSLRTLVETLLAHPLPMMLLWGTGLTQIYNDPCRVMMGGKHPFAFGMAARDCWPDDWLPIAPLCDRVLNNGESGLLENSQSIGLTKDLKFAAAYSPVRDEDDAIAGILISFTEPGVSQSEQALNIARQTHEMHAKMAAIVESSDDAIIGKTISGIITTWNRGAERIFGYSPGETIGKAIYLIIPADHHHEETEIRARLARGERIDHFETVRIAKDGSRIDVSLSVSPIKDMKGQITGASKIIRDISAKKRTEAALAQHARELARSNQELEHFAYVTSHDLQEPLRTVHSFAQLLDRSAGASLSENARVHLGFIKTGVKRMQALIADLLTYCRISTTGSEFTPCDCTELCDTLLKSLKTIIELHRAEISIAPLPTIVCDATQIGQVFQNLLVNAIKFHGPEAPVVRVTSSESSDEWIFSVSDQGIGIDSEFFDRIFVIFQRLHTVEEFGGTGIGLATCKKIVERHGGRIWVESSLGKGSTFHFSVPKQVQHAKSPSGSPDC